MDDVSWIPLAYFRLYWIRCKFYSDNRETFSFETLKFLAVVHAQSRLSHRTTWRCANLFVGYTIPTLYTVLPLYYTTLRTRNTTSRARLAGVDQRALCTLYDFKLTFVEIVAEFMGEHKGKDSLCAVSVGIAPARKEKDRLWCKKASGSVFSGAELWHAGYRQAAAGVGHCCETLIVAIPYLYTRQWVIIYRVVHGGSIRHRKLSTNESGIRSHYSAPAHIGINSQI